MATHITLPPFISSVPSLPVEAHRSSLIHILKARIAWADLSEAIHYILNTHTKTPNLEKNQDLYTALENLKATATQPLAEEMTEILIAALEKELQQIRLDTQESSAYVCTNLLKPLEIIAILDPPLMGVKITTFLAKTIKNSTINFSIRYRVLAYHLATLGAVNPCLSTAGKEGLIMLFLTLNDQVGYGPPRPSPLSEAIAEIFEQSPILVIETLLEMAAKAPVAVGKMGVSLLAHSLIHPPARLKACTQDSIIEALNTIASQQPLLFGLEEMRGLIDALKDDTLSPKVASAIRAILSNLIKRLPMN